MKAFTGRPLEAVTRILISQEVGEAKFSMVEALASGVSITLLEQFSRGIVVSALVVVVAVSVGHRVRRATRKEQVHGETLHIRPIED